MFVKHYFKNYRILSCCLKGSLVKLLTDEDPSSRPEAKELKNHSLLLKFQESIKRFQNNENKQEKVEQNDKYKEKEENRDSDTEEDEDDKTFGESENEGKDIMTRW